MRLRLRDRKGMAAAAAARGEDVIHDFYAAIWKEDADTVGSLMHEDCEAVYEDTGRSWKGRKQGVERLLIQVRSLKKQKDASVKVKVFFSGAGVYKVHEILKFNGKETETRCVFSLKGDEICKIDYVNIE